MPRCESFFLPDCTKLMVWMQGFYYITGRSKELIKVRGFQVRRSYQPLDKNLTRSHRSHLETSKVYSSPFLTY